jgi:hypothetical protein
MDDYLVTPRKIKAEWRSPVPYLMTGVALWCISQFIATTGWASRSGLRGLLYLWYYIHALPLALGLENLPEGYGALVGRLAARLIFLCYFVVIAFFLWLLAERLFHAHVLRRLRGSLRPVCAWAVFEVIYAGAFTALVLMGLVKD